MPRRRIGLRDDDHEDDRGVEDLAREERDRTGATQQIDHRVGDLPEYELPDGGPALKREFVAAARLQTGRGLGRGQAVSSRREPLQRLVRRERMPGDG